MAWKVLGDREEALDVVQETFLRAYRGAADFRAQSGFYAWLRRIALNLAIDRVRARRGENSPLEEETLAAERHAPGAARLAEEIREMRALRRRLATALRSSIETHLTLIDSLEQAPEEEEEGKVTYLARNARTRQVESSGGS